MEFLYIVLLVIFFLIIISIDSAFIYFHWCLKKILFVLSLIPIIKQQLIKHTNKKYQTT